MKSLKTILLIILAGAWHYLKSFVSFFFNFLKSQYKANPQILWIPILFVVWAVSVPLLRLIDPTAAVFDAGIFQIPLYGVILLVFALFITWHTVRIIFGTIQKYLKTEFKTDFIKLTKWQKITLSFSVFFALLFVLALFMLTL